jgi:hypothetical protein
MTKDFWVKKYCGIYYIPAIRYEGGNKMRDDPLGDPVPIYK